MVAGASLVYAVLRGEHVNILLRYQDGKLTTVGGNEGNAIHVSTIERAAVGKIRGFGAAE